jgi:type I restriction enzyme M protein
VEIDLAAIHRKLEEIEDTIRKSTPKHNEFLKELGLSPLPTPDPAPSES